MTRHDCRVERIEAPAPALLLELERLDRAAMGETAAGRYTLRAIVDHGHLFAIRAGGGIAGCAQYLAHAGDPFAVHLFGFFVAADHRGTGLGRELLRASLETLRTLGVRRVDLTVEPGNAAAIALYRSAGFGRDVRSADHYGPGEDRLILECALAPPSAPEASA